MKAAERYLEWIAKRCREAYIYERTQYEISRNSKLQNRKPAYRYVPAQKWDGGTDDDGKTFTPIWTKIAQFVIANGLDPETVMRKRFMMAKGSNPPWPNQVACATYIDNYTGAHELLSEDDIEIGFKLDKEYCRTAITSARYLRDDKSANWSWTAMLLDNSLDITPLMRYCLACDLKLPAVMRCLELRALAQYSKAPKAYNKVWGKSISEEFKAAAASLVGGVNNGR